MKSEEIVARARVLIGVRFRPQGRSAELGLDCVGVAAMAMEVKKAPRDYCLRTSDPNAAEEAIGAVGFLRIPPDQAGVGDMLLVRPGPGHLHIAILTDHGYVHADMRLRRVLEVPGPLPWAVLSAWRHPEHEEAASLPARSAGRD